MWIRTDGIPTTLCNRLRKPPDSGLTLGGHRLIGNTVQGLWTIEQRRAHRFRVQTRRTDELSYGKPGSQFHPLFERRSSDLWYGARPEPHTSHAKSTLVFRIGFGQHSVDARAV